MPTSGESDRDLLVDTSVAIALVVSDHKHHAATSEAVAIGGWKRVGHAAFETFSVLDNGGYVNFTQRREKVVVTTLPRRS